MIFETLPVGPLQCNCRILVCPKTFEALIVDPGDEADRILKRLGEIEIRVGQKVSVKYLFHTHAHFDHFGATREVKQKLSDAKISLHRGDADLYQALPQQGKMFGFEYAAPIPVEKWIEDDEIIRLGELKLSFIHTPGHSPGGLCLRVHEDSSLGAKEQVMSGDTLFQESVGRTDLWGGDSELLLKSIRTRLLTLDDDTRVCPGHGPDSTIGHEKRNNPFFD